MVAVWLFGQRDGGAGGGIVASSRRGLLQRSNGDTGLYVQRFQLQTQSKGCQW